MTTGLLADSERVKKFQWNARQSSFSSAKVCGMETQRQVSGGVATVAAKPMSAHALLRGVSREGLTSGVRCVSVAGMKTRPNTGGAVAGAGQPDPPAVLLRGAAGADRFFEGFCGSVFLGLGVLRLDLRHNGYSGQPCAKKAKSRFAIEAL